MTLKRKAAGQPQAAPPAKVAKQEQKHDVKAKPEPKSQPEQKKQPEQPKKAEQPKSQPEQKKPEQKQEQQKQEQKKQEQKKQEQKSDDPVLGQARELQGGLKVIDTHLGDGKRAKAGDQVTVKYTGKLTNGKVFDSGVIPFRLGVGSVIAGWDKGIVGMKVGGKRELVIPPALAYGQRGSPPDIPKNATLLFAVELKKC
eukprot:TRINITY_DN1098_c0_g1_i1.p1 TRINITY_DN1098_c0_g1~~TRINITY_DN1098_c0_g1_i1.p1  ORF type:complete len:199 (+),score=44.05 TRINITY_DN1098_c0_g1_i1:119-715(+)